MLRRDTKRAFRLGPSNQIKPEGGEGMTNENNNRAQHNPNVTKEGKRRAKEGLGHLPEE